MKKTLLSFFAIGSLTLSGAALGQHHGGGHHTGGHHAGAHHGGSHHAGGHHVAGHHRFRHHGFGHHRYRHRGSVFLGLGLYSYPYSYGYGYPYGYGYGYPYGYGYAGYRTVYNGRPVQQTARLSVEAAVQSALANQGYYRGRIDGVIGARSRAAIREYQRQNGLPVTGRVDRSLLDSLGI